ICIFMDDTTKDLDIELREREEARAAHVMTQLINDTPAPPAEGDLVEGAIIGFGRGAVYIDLPPFGTGIIFGREYISARDVIRNANIGDNITAKVVAEENEDGYIELSLKEARQALIWSEAEDAIKQKKPLEVLVKDANKGGLILEWQGIAGFLPASQLSSEHYPRVEDGNKDQILSELKKLVGQRLNIQIISASPKEGKLIFSEKSPNEKDKTAIVGKYTVGDEVDGEVTGIVDFGVFLKVEEGLEGLVHISEIDWGLVEDTKALFRAGDKVKAKIIEIKDGKISLSIKALKQNPWADAMKKYAKDQIVDGVVIKFNKHGALVSIEEGVAGLAHISEFGAEEKLRQTLELGKTYKFKITLFEPKDQRMTLSWKEANA
ncbi:MAG: S1 RNA-binding domain-containing protein, partial [Patescibacteria group bacterium]